MVGTRTIESSTCRASGEGAGSARKRVAIFSCGFIKLRVAGEVADRRWGPLWLSDVEEANGTGGSVSVPGRLMLDGELRLPESLVGGPNVPLWDER